MGEVVGKHSVFGEVKKMIVLIVLVLDLSMSRREWVALSVSRN